MASETLPRYTLIGEWGGETRVASKGGGANSSSSSGMTVVITVGKNKEFCSVFNLRSFLTNFRNITSSLSHWSVSLSILAPPKSNSYKHEVWIMYEFFLMILAKKFFFLKINIL